MGRGREQGFGVGRRRTTFKRRGEGVKGMGRITRMRLGGEGT